MPSVIEPRVCAICSSPLPAEAHHAKKYCDSCQPQVKLATKRRLWREKTLPRACQRCGTDISSTVGSRKYCDSCQEIAHKEKHVQSMAEYRAKIRVPGYAGVQKSACPIYVIVCETCKREAIVLTKGQKKCPNCKKGANAMKDVMLGLREKILSGDISGVQEAREYATKLILERVPATDAQTVETLVNRIIIDKRGVVSET